MAAATTRLALRKPDGDPTTGDFVDVDDDLNDNYDKLDAAVGAVPCTSGARPATPYNGQFARETDTGNLILCTSTGPSVWKRVFIEGGKIGAVGVACTSGTRPSAPIVGEIAFETDTLRCIQWNGTGWVGLDAIPNANGVSNASTTSGTDSLTSGTYVNMSGTGSVTNFNVTKRQAGTKMRLAMNGTFYTSSSASGASFALRINSTDYEISRISATVVATNHTTFAGFVYVTGIAAGLWNVQARWRRLAGAGTVTRDADDWLALEAMEVT